MPAPHAARRGRRPLRVREFFKLSARPRTAGREAATQAADPRERVRACTGLAEQNFRRARNFSLALGTRTLAWLLPALPLTAPPPTGYRIDSAHSQAAFGVRLLWLHEINGRFRHIDGAVLPGPQAGTVVVSADIAVDSVVMDSARMRRWVLAPEFFDAADYPDIRFVSDPLPQAVLEHGGPLPGRLSLRGVTAPVSFTLHPLHCEGAPPAPCRIALNGALQRSGFGLTAHRTALSDRVELTLAIALSPLPSRESRVYGADAPLTKKP
jgi:polyisoprenoid-binding protein YceI